MALTAPTKNANQEGNVVTYSGGLGADDNDIIFTVDVRGYETAVSYSLLGTYDIEGSVDGTNFGVIPLSAQPLTTTSSPGTWVVVSTADIPLRVDVRGFSKIRYRQAGATPPSNFSVGLYKASSP
jgi:hypothetical protein